MLRPHQQVDRAQVRALGEQLEHVPLAVRHADRADAVQLRGQVGAVAQPARPALRLALRGRLVLPRLAVRRVELDQRHAQRQAVPVDRQRGMHVQPQGALGVGVLADRARPVAAGPLGEVEVGAVLQAQHGVPVLHALQGAGAVRGEDARRRDLRVGGPVEQAVAALDQGPVGLRGGREGGARGVGLHGGAAHQALRQARIAEGGAAELLRGPGVAVEARGGVEGGQARRGHAEFRAPVRPQGEQEDGLGRHGGAGRGEAAAPGGPPGRDPVGGDEAGAVVAAAIDEGLEQQGLVAVAVPEVVRQAAQAEGQRLGGEVAALRGGPHREAAEGRHAVQQAAALEVVPADPAVAVGQLQGGGGEAEGAEDAVVGDDEVAQPGAGVADGAPGMLGGDEFVPDQAALVVGDEFEGQAARVLDAGGDALRRRDGAVEAARGAVPALVERGGQLELAAVVEDAQGLGAAGELGTAQGVEEAELGADAAGDGAAPGQVLVLLQGLDARDGLRKGQSLEDAVLLVHASLRTLPVILVKP